MELDGRAEHPEGRRAGAALSLEIHVSMNSARLNHDTRSAGYRIADTTISLTAHPYLRTAMPATLDDTCCYRA